jgi:hypothetical protein
MPFDRTGSYGHTLSARGYVLHLTDFILSIKINDLKTGFFGTKFAILFANRLK